MDDKREITIKSGRVNIVYANHYYGWCRQKNWRRHSVGCQIKTPEIAHDLSSPSSALLRPAQTCWLCDRRSCCALHWTPARFKSCSSSKHFSSRAGFYRHEKFRSDIHVHRPGPSLVIVWTFLKIFDFWDLNFFQEKTLRCLTYQLYWWEPETWTMKFNKFKTYFSAPLRPSRLQLPRTRKSLCLQLFLSSQSTWSYK